MAVSTVALSDALEAIRSHEGNVVAACEALGCCQRTFYRLTRRHASLRAALGEARDARRAWRKDVARGVLDAKLLEGDWRAVRYVLSADPEFAPRQHVEHDGEMVIRWVMSEHDPDGNDPL